MKSYKIFLFALSCLLVNQIAGQINCNNYLDKKCGEGYGEPFKYSGQSKSAVFEKGQKSSFYIIVYGGFEYSVSLCADKNLDGILFRIIEDSPQKTVLYDSNLEGDKMKSKQFMIEKTKKLIVEVEVPDGEVSASEEKYEDRIGCIGIVVEYLRAPKKGFE